MKTMSPKSASIEKNLSPILLCKSYDLYGFPLNIFTMNKIRKLSNAATVDETATIAQSVAVAVTEAAVNDVYLNGETEILKLKAESMLIGIGLARGKVLRQELLNADLLRDNLFSTLTRMLKAYMKWNKPDQAQAATTLMKIIHNHGKGIVNLSIEKESARLDSILNLFDQAEHVAAFATLGLSDLHAELKAAQANLKAIYQQSAEAESEKAAIISPSFLKRETLKQLGKIVDYLNVMHDADAAKYGALASKMVQLIDDLNTKIKIRNSNAPGAGEEVSNN